MSDETYLESLLRQGLAHVDDRGKIVRNADDGEPATTAAERFDDAWLRQYQPDRWRAKQRAAALREDAAKFSPAQIRDFLDAHYSATEQREADERRVGHALEPYTALGELSDVAYLRVADIAAVQAGNVFDDSNTANVNDPKSTAAIKAEGDALLVEMQRDALRAKAADMADQWDALPAAAEAG